MKSTPLEFPSHEWISSSPTALGWSEDGLQRVLDYASNINTTALVVVDHGISILSHGDVSKKLNCFSIRKSFLNSIIGIHVERGDIDLSKTVSDLGLSDHLGLSDIEQTAKLYDLLMCRSGIYHSAGYETNWMKQTKPPRHSYAPGANYYYNNWDFNAIGTAFEQLTGAKIHQAFDQLIAQRIGMQDFRLDGEEPDGWYVEEEASRHKAYPFRISARDLARFGHLFLSCGLWRDEQVVPSAWVELSAMPYSEAGARGAYGFMWWVARQGVAFPMTVVPNGTYWAEGSWGQYCLVVPELGVVVSHMTDSNGPENGVSSFQFGKLVKLLLSAKRSSPS